MEVSLLFRGKEIGIGKVLIVWYDLLDILRVKILCEVVSIDVVELLR